MKSSGGVSVRQRLALVLGVVAATLGMASIAAGQGDRPLRRIAFGSCSDQELPQPIWSAVAKTKPQLFLYLGDNIYGDTDDMEVMRAKYAKQAAVPGFAALREAVPVLGTWDDHDYGRNDAGEEYQHRAASQQLFLDFFGVPQDSPRRKHEGVYSTQLFGPEGRRLQVILLDTRYFRSPLKRRPAPERGYAPNTDPGATILGEAQWSWLEQQLRVPAEVRVIASSIQVVAEDHGSEKWMNIPRERERLFRLIKETGARGVLFISGDRHLAELSMMDGSVGYPLYDLTSSGLNRSSKTWRPYEVNRHRVATLNRGDNFGIIDVDWRRTDPRVSLQIRDEEGDVAIRQEIDLSLLQPKPAAAQ